MISISVIVPMTSNSIEHDYTFTGPGQPQGVMDNFTMISPEFCAYNRQRYWVFPKSLFREEAFREILLVRLSTLIALHYSTSPCRRRQASQGPSFSSSLSLDRDAACLGAGQDQRQGAVQFHSRYRSAGPICLYGGCPQTPVACLLNG